MAIVEFENIRQFIPKCQYKINHKKCDKDWELYNDSDGKL